MNIHYAFSIRSDGGDDDSDDDDEDVDKGGDIADDDDEDEIYYSFFPGKSARSWTVIKHCRLSCS